MVLAQEPAVVEVLAQPLNEAGEVGVRAQPAEVGVWAQQLNEAGLLMQDVEATLTVARGKRAETTSLKAPTAAAATEVVNRNDAAAAGKMGFQAVTLTETRVIVVILSGRLGAKNQAWQRIHNA